MKSISRKTSESIMTVTVEAILEFLSTRMWPQTVNTVDQFEESVMKLTQKEARADLILTS